MRKKLMALLLSVAVISMYTFGSVGSIFAEDASTDTGNSTQTEQSNDNTSDTQTGTSDTTQTDADDTTQYPAVELSGSAGGVDVKISAPEGALPEGTTVSVTAVSDEKAQNIVEKAVSDGVSVEDAKAVDITFYDKDGNKIEPKSEVKVTFSGADVSGDSYGIYHESSSGDVEKVADIDSGNGGTVSAKDFSIYAIAGISKNYRATYEFYNGTELVDTQVVKDGENLVEPSVPTGSSANEQFVGWAQKDTPNTYQTFGKVSVSGDSTIKLYAQYKTKYYVSFHGTDGIIVQMKSGVSGDKINISDVTIPVVNADEACVGWSLTKDGTETVGDTVTLDNSNVDLYPVIKTVSWVTFDANGGSYTAPEYALPGNTVAEPTPTKAGYEFEGWYTDKDFTHEYDFSTAVDGNITLYAKWDAQKVNYTVVYWQEALKDGKYVKNNYAYKETETKEALAGSTITAGSMNSYTYYHFSKIDGSKTVNGDGSTIVNVYYDLNTYTLKFDLDNNGAKLTQNGKVYTGDSYSFTARMGEDISSEWPLTVSDGSFGNWYDGYYTLPFYGWESPNEREANLVSKRLNLTPKMLDKNEIGDGDTTTFKALYSTGYKLELHYMLENAEGGTYTDSTKYRQSVISPSGSFDAKEIDGFKHDKTDKSDLKWNHGNSYYETYKFYYTRNAYDLKFYNHNTTDKSYSVKYDASISGYNYTPTRPSGLSREYNFMGWYTTEDFQTGTEFTFDGAKMPSNNLMLYAKWSTGDATVTFDSNGGTEIDGSPFSVEIGKTISKPTDPTKKGYTFAGWMNGGDPFNFDTEIHQDTTLTAKWLSNSKLTVKYYAGLDIPVPSDSNSYADGSSAEVLSAAIAPAGEYFQGWELNGKTYYPGDTFTIDSSLAENNVITLTAKYGQKTPDTKLTYHANGGVGDDIVIDNLKNNSDVILLDKNLTQFTKAGYHITSWNTQADGKGTEYALGATVGVDIFNESNDLYAQWAPNTDVSYTVKYVDKNTDKEIANAKTVTGQTFDTTVTEDAADIKGYIAEEPTSQDLTLNEYDQTITFYYTAKTDVGYTVKYVDKDTKKEIAEDKKVTGKTFNTTVTEEAIAIKGYTAEKPTSQDLTLNEYDQTITFYYTAKTDVGYTVKYVDKDTKKEIAEDKKVTGKTFNTTVTEEAIAIKGYTAEKPTSQDLTLNEYDQTITFYYTAKTDVGYTVKYVDKDTKKEIAEDKKVTGKTFNTTVTEEAIAIKGYTAEKPTSQDLTLNEYDQTITFYYTAKTDVGYTVKYVDKDTKKEIAEDKKVTGKTFNTTVTEEAIAIKGYTAEKPTSQDLTLNEYDQTITFYYTAKTDVGYTVKYVDKDTKKEIAEDKKVTGKTFNTTVTEEAIAIKGYTAEKPTSQDLTLNEYDQTITFYYTAKTDVGYTVKYVDKDTKKEIAEDKKVTGKTFNTTVTEEAIAIKGYTAEKPTSQDLTLNEYDQTITFYYTAKTDVGYTVKYVDKDTKKEIAEDKKVTGKTFNTTVTEEAIAIKGYTAEKPTSQDLTLNEYDQTITFYYTAKTDVGYTVKYVDKDTKKEIAEDKKVTGKTFNTTVTEEAIAIKGYTAEKPTSQDLTLNEYDQTITFYYTAKTDVGYTVKYVDKDTKKEIAEDKKVTGKTFNTTVTEEAIAIKGYTAEKPTSQDLTLNEYDQTITFYYTAKTDVGYTVKYVDKDTKKEIAEDKKVTGKTFNTTVTEEAIAIKGYTAEKPTSQDLTLNEYDQTITFYYTAKTDVGYTVKYVDKDTKKEIAEDKKVTGKTFNTTVTEEAIAIKGYTAEKPTSQDLTLNEYDQTITFYYTAKTDVGYTVKYVDKDTKKEIAEDKKVTGKTFNTTVTEEAIAIKGYTAEKPTSQDLTLNEYDQTITFYYTAKTDVGYTVKYVDKDTKKEIAEDKKVTGKTFNTTVTEEAIAIKGYTAEKPTSQDLTLNEYDQTITFYYTAKTDVGYTVKYVDKDTKKEIAEDKKVTGKTFNTTVTEEAIAIKGYTAEKPTSQDLTLNEYDQTITFYYTAKTDVGYTVKYVDKDTKKEIAEDKKVTGKTFNTTVTEEAIAIKGYTAEKPTSQDLTLNEYDQTITFYYTAKTDVGYTVKYVDKDTKKEIAEDKKVTGKTFNTTVTEEAIAIKGYTAEKPTSQDLTLNEYDQTITFYYTAKTDVGYTVKYVDKDTKKEIAEDKKVTGKTFNTTVTEEAIAIKGYTAEKPTSQDLTLNEYDQTITFYYTANDYKLTINYYQDGTTTKVADSYEKTVTFGKDYSQKSPTVNNYVLKDTKQDVVSGSMPASDLTINVYYTYVAPYVPPVVQDTTYNVVANYYTSKDEGKTYTQDNTSTVEVKTATTVKVGDALTVTPEDAWATYDGNKYFIDAEKSEMTKTAVLDAASNTLTLNYYRNVGSDDGDNDNHNKDDGDNNNNGGNGGNGSSSDNPSNNNSAGPDTGDSNDLGFWAGICGASGVLLAGLYFGMRRRENSDSESEK